MDDRVPNNNRPRSTYILCNNAIVIASAAFTLQDSWLMKQRLDEAMDVAVAVISRLCAKPTPPTHTPK